jgi:hypothetical protein
MPSKKRNYQKEYARRIELGKKRGIKKSQARGHARAKYGESSIRELREAGKVEVREQEEGIIKKYYGVVNRVLKGESLTSATKQEHISAKTFDKLNKSYDNFLGRTYKESSKGGKAVHSGYFVPGIREIYILVDIGNGPELIDIQAVRPERSHVGTYWNLVDNALHGNTSSLKAFKYNPIHDIHGNTYTLVTDPNTLQAWIRSLSDSKRRELKESIYRSMKASA